jgi:hypothetical protein
MAVSSLPLPTLSTSNALPLPFAPHALTSAPRPSPWSSPTTPKTPNALRELAERPFASCRIL